MTDYTFDVVIATYNRPESLEELITSINLCIYRPNKIIIVDSSHKENTKIKKYQNVLYIRSSHANQPYQRYVGYLASNADILFFFDDDMIIENENFFNNSINYYQKQDIVGLTYQYRSHHFFLDTMHEAKFQNFLKKLNIIKIFKTISGNPTINDGEYWLCGIKGRPIVNEKILYFYGAAFSLKKRKMYKNFNFNLFNIYEKGLGKGEDGILGYTVSKEGELRYIEGNLYHNDQGNSVYTQNHKKYAMRTIYSRLYLSFEYCRLNNKSYLMAWLHYNWFICGRVISILINTILHPKKERLSYLNGMISGWYHAIKDTMILKQYISNTYWKKEAFNDIKKSSY
jgi:glycosyltransferase involved in cell wall biosynthesis